jgi:predicted regulator of Ras-like GTPase activity (Roadblock/LC7/MglB family)
MFTDLLNSVLDRVDGSVACVLMGFDGIPVESVTAADLAADGFDPKELAVEYSAHIQNLRRTAADTGQGDLEEAHIRTGALQAVARVLDDNYFLLLLLDPDGIAGKGRFVLRVLAPQVRIQL